MIIRRELDIEVADISRVTEAAFRDRDYAGGDEQVVIDRLSNAGDLSLSLVAIDDDDLIGQVTFSPATNEDQSDPWFALGPISVKPNRQGQGIGTALIHEGLAQISDQGALGCILTGNPAYYGRFGFSLVPELAPAREPGEFFMLKTLNGNRPTSPFEFHPAFYGEL